MSISERDKKHLWHPLTQHQLGKEHLVIAKAEGAVLVDENGKEYIDGIASWYTCMYGHCHPSIINAIKTQLTKLDQVVFSGFTHQPAVEMSEALMDILPSNQQKIFFSDNGSTAVDVAIKMALQYHFNKGVKRTQIIALEDGFHGDTFGAMSVSGLSVYNGPFEEHFIDVARIPVPTTANITEVKAQLQSILDTQNVAAFIYEPLVQGAAAMQMYDGALLDELLIMVKKSGALNIADEVMTGFGKTGTYFASEQIATKPDLICLAKSLTAGVVPMALTTCTQKVYEAFLSAEISKGFFHGHTYSANPLACTAALAAMNLLKTDEFQAHIQRINQAHLAFEGKIKAHPKVKSTRVTGVIFALDLNLQMERYGNLRDQLFSHFMKQGVFLRPLGNTIYILAPFVTTNKQLEKIYQSIEQALEIV